MSSLLRVVFDPDLTPPAVPAITAAVPVSQTRIDITWTTVTDNPGGVGLAGYDILIDGVTVIQAGVQTSYSATGFTAGTTHTFQVRARDLATPPNLSAYSAQVQATTIAAPAVYNPNYPRLGTYALGGQQLAASAELARRHVNIVPHYPGWQQSKGTSLSALVTAAKSASTIGSKVFAYTIYPEIPDVNANAGQANWEVWQYALANNLWAYQNGQTETTRVASYQAGWSKLNYTSNGKLVGGKNFVQWKIDWDTKLNRTGGSFSNGTSSLTVTANAALDGLFFDNVFYQERAPAADYDRNGSIDTITSAASQSYIQGSHAAAISYYRSQWPTSPILVNSADWGSYTSSMTGSPLDQQADGGVIEHAENFESTFAACVQNIKVQMDGYRAPKLGVLEVDIVSLTNYTLMRYWLGISLLTDTYFYPHAGSGLLTQDLPNTWYDEFSFDLGAAIEPVQTAARYQAGASGEGVWRRDFANGIVLVAAKRANGSSTAYSPVSLGGTFFRLVGTQAPTVNSGASATSISLSPRDAIVLARTPQVGAGVFPLTINSGGRYLQDNTGAPFLIHGDTAWSLAVQLTRTQIDTYLNDRQTKGFNTILFNAAEHFFSANSPAYRNREGNDPFTPMTNFGGPTEAYWQFVDYIVVNCLSRGMVALINPAYLGFGGGSEGWMSEVTAETAADLQSYGAFLANRYASYGNVIWCMGGDYAGTTTERNKQWNIVTGILSVDPDAIITAHGARTQSATSLWNGFTGYTLNNIYTDGTEYTYAATEYARTPVKPFFLFEGYYDDARTGSPPATAADCRRQAYASILSGACGHMFGNFPIWDFGSPVANGSGGGVTAALTNLSTTATNQMAYVKALFTAFNWHLLQPRTDTSLVTTGLGSGTTRIIPARASDGTFAMVWTTGAGFTINLNALTINSILAQWYNPTDGTYATIGTFSNLGTQAFTPPGGAERVLVLSQAPGSGGTFFSGFSLESGSAAPADGATVTFLSATNAFGAKENGEKALEVWEPTKGNTLLSAESRNGTAWPTSLGASAPRYGSIVTTSPLPPNATSVWQVMYSGAGNNGFWGPLPHPTNGSNIQFRRTWRVNFNGAQAFAARADWNLKNDRVWDTGFTHDAVGGYADGDLDGNPRYVFENTDGGIIANQPNAGYGLAVNVWMPETTFIRQSATVGANGNMTVFQFGRRRVNYSAPTRSSGFSSYFGQVFGPQRERLTPDSTWFQRCGDYIHDDSFCAIEITDQPPPGNDASTSNWETEWCVPIEWSATGGRIKCRIRKGVYSLANKYIRVRKSDGTTLVYIYQFPSTA